MRMQNAMHEAWGSTWLEGQVHRITTTSGKERKKKMMQCPDAGEITGCEGEPHLFDDELSTYGSIGADSGARLWVETTPLSLRELELELIVFSSPLRILGSTTF